MSLLETAKEIFFSTLLCANAQITKFNRTYSDTTPTMRNIVVTDTGYVIVGGGGSPVYILTAFVDSQGSLVNIKKIRMQGYDLFHGKENSLYKLKEGGYILAGSYNKLYSNENGACFLKFDKNFDTLRLCKYFNDTVKQTILYGCTQVLDSCNALIGTQSDGSSYSDVVMIKTDSVGTMQWYKKYGYTSVQCESSNCK